MKILLLYTLLLWLFGSCSHHYYPIGKNMAIVADGSAREWNPATFIKAPEVNLFYAAEADSDNLYFIIKCMDKITSAKLLIMGTTVWIDPKGQEKATVGIIHPEGVAGYLLKAIVHSHSGKIHEAPQLKQQVDETLETLQLIDHRSRNMDTLIYNIQSSESPVSVALARDNGDHVVYELSIPLSLLGSSRKISIGFETHHMAPDIIASEWNISRDQIQLIRQTDLSDFPMLHRLRTINQPVKGWITLKIK